MCVGEDEVCARSRRRRRGRLINSIRRWIRRGRRPGGGLARRAALGGGRHGGRCYSKQWRLTLPWIFFFFFP
uniref:Uncharacterized protein K0007B01.31 n=1 Tax=Oryza sativa subsp. indica TaxID=39946 RepID=C8TET5_ORYSI|nr:hypothetical protein [Oryza sativa Indica Group]BAI39762.1 hypothetical protein [Oryza sativa Indica Group]